MKPALYSAIFGDYEATAKQLPPDLGIPAYMFTDNPAIAEQAPAAGWSVVFDNSAYLQFTADPANGDPAVVTPMLAHKYWETHPAEAIEAAGLDADASIWVDGNMRITMPGAAWVAANVAALGDDEWSLMKHPWRDTVAAEHAYTAAVCSGRYSVAAMQRLIDALFDEPTAFRDDVGLFASGHMVRRHTETVREICGDWWAMNVAFTHQDQLSLPFLLRKYENCPDDRFRPRWNANLPWGLWELMGHGA